MEGLNTSPSQRMFGRYTRTHLQAALAIGERNPPQEPQTSLQEQTAILQLTT